MAPNETKFEFVLWPYIPSLPVAIIFIILFSIATILHIVKTVQNRMWFCIPFIVGGTFEIVGYIGRALAYNDRVSIGPYIIQSLLLLLAPVLFSASLYMTLGRTIRVVRGDQYSIIAPRWLTRIFVAGDIFSFIVQSGGGGLLAVSGKSNSLSPQAAENIIVGGLVLQILLFAVFVSVALTFHLKFRKHQTIDTQHVPWCKTFLMLYLASAAILVRNIFRVIEWVAGQGGYLLLHEWTLYVFDGALMLFTMMIFWWYWPINPVARKIQDAEVQLDPRNARQSHTQER